MPTLNFTPQSKAVLAALGLEFPPLKGSVTFHPDCKFEAPMVSGARVHPRTPVEIGACSLLNGGGIAAVKIGRYCSLADGVAIGFAEHPTDRLTSSTLGFSHNFSGWHDHFVKEGHGSGFQAMPFDDRPWTAIGNDVWIGYGAFIKAGVVIGDGAVVAAHAVVVSDVPPYAIVAGIPAKPMRKRFSDSTIDRLLALQWWRYALSDFSGIDIRDIEQSLNWLERHIVSLKPYAGRTFSASDLAEILATS